MPHMGRCVLFAQKIDLCPEVQANKIQYTL